MVSRRAHRRSLARSRSARSRRVRDVVGTDGALQRSAALWIHGPRRGRPPVGVSVARARWDPSRSRRHSTPRRSRVPARARRCRSRSRCSISASSPASATSTRARRCITRGCRRCRKASTIAIASGAPKATATQPGRIDQGGADERDQAARVTVSIGAFSGLRTRRTVLSAPRLRRNHQTDLAGGPLDVLLFEVSEVGVARCPAWLPCQTVQLGPRRCAMIKV